MIYLTHFDDLVVSHILKAIIFLKKWKLYILPICSEGKYVLKYVHYQSKVFSIIVTFAIALY